MTRDPLLPAGDGHTDLGEDERDRLRPSYIATRGDLFEAEQRNIAEALRRRAPSVEDLLDDLYLRRLHRSMLGDVWDWAGRYRQTETNIGVAPPQIAAAVRALVEDVRAWVTHDVYEPHEIAVRFHHRLVAIHPFRNGNGRLSRIAADYLVAALGGVRFTWGSGSDLDTEALRAAYLHALRQADNGDFGALVAFARS